jgi:hypothetical protein
MKRILILLFFINILTSFGFGQIQIGGNDPNDKKAKKEKVKKESNDSTTYGIRVFLGSTYASTFRTLIPNKNELFADSLGVRSDEVSRPAWAFHLGFTSDISRYLMWEAGVSFMQNGERYRFSDTDTSHTYSAKYSWIGVPLKLYFKHDFNKLRLQVGVGAIPHMQLKFRKTDVFTNQQGVETTVETKTTTGMNNFGISAVGNIGLHYSITNRFGIYASFEYRHQLTSSYLKTYPYAHRGTAIGANFGLTFGL